MSTNYIEKVKRLRTTSLEGCWPLNDESGTVVLNVGPKGSDVNGTSSALVRVPSTRGFAGPDGGRCAQFDGSASYIDLYTATAAASTITVAEGSLSIWAATPQANLKATTKMQIMLLAADTANQIGIDFDTTAYRFSGDYFAGSGDATYSTTYGKLIYNVDGGIQKPEWHHLGLTYSVAADKVILYVDGTASTVASSLGTWTGAWGSTLCSIATSKTSLGDLFTGWLAHVALWSTPLTAPEMKQLSEIGP